MEQQVVIITGAGSGIGRETAKLLATKGKALVLVDFDETSGLDTLHAVKEHQLQAIFVQADVSQSQDVKNMWTLQKKHLAGLMLLSIMQAF